MTTETTLTVLTDEARTVPAQLTAGTASVEPDRLESAIGWELKPEGLCRGNRCVTVPKPSDLTGPDGAGIDLVAVAAALDRPALLDADAGVLAVGQPAASRRQTTEGRSAAPFSLPDLDGSLHTLEEFRGRKKLLVAFASW